LFVLQGQLGSNEDTFKKLGKSLGLGLGESDGSFEKIQLCEVREETVSPIEGSLVKPDKGSFPLNSGPVSVVELGQLRYTLSKDCEPTARLSPQGKKLLNGICERIGLPQPFEQTARFSLGQPPGCGRFHLRCLATVC
jgi:hypothetical protein